MSASARPAPRCAATRPSTSRSGTSSARRPNQPIAQLLGGFSRDSDPHLQHLRRHRLHAGRPRARRTANWGLGAEQGLRRSQRLPAPRRRAGRGAPRGGHHGHEDLAVRPSPPRRATATTSRAADLKAALRALREDPQARSATRMDIMVEFHSLWQLLPAITDRQGARRLTPPSGTRTRSGWTASATSSAMPRPSARRRSAPRRRWARAGPSAICWRPAPPASSCSTFPGAADFPRRARSPRWRRPGTCRSRRTTAPGRWCSRPRRICRSTRPTRSSRRACAPSTGPGIAIW